MFHIGGKPIGCYLLLALALTIFSAGSNSVLSQDVTGEEHSMENSDTLFQPNPNLNVKRNIFQRFAGKPATKLPESNDCWSYNENKLIVDLEKIPELKRTGSALRCEGENLTEPVLVIHGDDGKFHAFRNKCTHGERRMDPVQGGFTVQCCSVGKSTFDYHGNVLKGSAKNPITVYPVELMEGNKLVVLVHE